MKKDTKMLDKEAERLEAIGQDNEKNAVADTTKIIKEEEHVHQLQESKTLETLQKARNGKIQTYTRLLANLLEGKLMGIDWPEGWERTVHPTEVGVILELRYGDRMFRSAFKATGEEKYDLNAVNTYVIRAENTVDRIMNPIANSLRGDKYAIN